MLLDGDSPVSLDGEGIPIGPQMGGFRGMTVGSEGGSAPRCPQYYCGAGSGDGRLNPMKLNCVHCSWKSASLNHWAAALRRPAGCDAIATQSIMCICAMHRCMQVLISCAAASVSEALRCALWNFNHKVRSRHQLEVTET